MATDAIFIGNPRDGRLNPAVTLALAAAGTAMVLAGLLFAFSHNISPPLTSARVLLRVIQVPAAAQTAAPSRRTTKPAEITKSAQPINLRKSLKTSVLRNLPPLVGSPASKLDLSMGIPSPTVPLSTGPAAHAFNPYSDLYQALNAPPKPSILKNGQTLRLVGHKAITKIAGRCYEEARLPMIGLSSLSGQTVFKVVHCPGEYQPSMDDELDMWANKEKQKLDGNGSG